LNKTITKKAGGVAQGVGPEFNPQHCKKRKQKERKKGWVATKEQNHILLNKA
jgi:hypothetical protein